MTGLSAPLLLFMNLTKDFKIYLITNYVDITQNKNIKLINQNGLTVHTSSLLHA